MKPSLGAIDFIAKRESCELTAYKDIAGVWTIGYGTIRYPNGERVKYGDKITQDQADTFLYETCSGICRRLVDLVIVPLNTNQMDALCSFCYNVGVPGFIGSTLRKRINDEMPARDSRIRDAFLMWNKAHVDGKLVAVPGLTARRRLEYRLYSEGVSE